MLDENEVIEDVEVVEGQDTEVTADESSDYGEALDGDEVKAEDESSEEEQVKETLDEIDPETEIEIEIGGKLFKGKQKEIVEKLEKIDAFTEKEKSLNRDYTQKMQQISETKKSLESAFGGQMPEKEDLANLGKVYQAYFQNPQYQAAINLMLQGQPLDSIVSGREGNPRNPQANPETLALRRELSSLRDSQGQLLQQIQQQNEQRQSQEAQKIWSSWESKQETKITDEVNAEMATYIPSISQRHPEWSDEQILDEALRHATIDDMKRNVTKQVLRKADGSKRSVPRITPKVPQKSASEESYADIFNQS